MAETSTDERFLSVDDGDTNDFIESMKNLNTKWKTQSDTKLFTTWLLKQNEERPMEDIEKDKLDQYSARFFLSVRNRFGNDYEPDTLKSIQASLSRYLMEKTQTNIMTDREFAHSRDVLSAKRKKLKGKGLGNKKRKAEPFSQLEISILFDMNLLGTSNPDALINTIWLNNTLHFGMRSRKEHQDMLWGDVEMKTTSSGLQYLEFTERETKTRKGDGTCRPFPPKMFATPDNPRCPVSIFKTYIRHRPANSFTPDS